MNEPKLTDELARGILAGIRAGGFPHVAAAAYGVELALWERWLRRGRRKHAREPYRSFVRKVEEAQGQARLRAEIAVLEKDIRAWLKHGPGRDRPGRPGWAAVVRPVPPPSKQTVDWLASPDFLRFAAMLRQVLAPYPDALAAVARMLSGEASAAGE
jgi:hypothetical protein